MSVALGLVRADSLVDEYSFESINVQAFIKNRWKATVDTYKPPETEQKQVDDVRTAKAFQTFLLSALQDLRTTNDTSLVNLMITIGRVHTTLRSYEKLIGGDFDDVSCFHDNIDESTYHDVDMSTLWVMAHLCVKLSMSSIDKLKRTAALMTDLRRQLELLVLSIRQTAQQGRNSLRMEMSETFESVLGVLYDSVMYLQSKPTDASFVASWKSHMQSQIKPHFDAMEATVRHIMAVASTTLSLQSLEIKRSDTRVEERTIPMDVAKRATFSVDNLPSTVISVTITGQCAEIAGRSAEVDNIHRHFDVSQNQNLRTYLLYGRRGVGKTQVALEYARRYRGYYDAVLWINCETAASVRKSFTDIATALELDGVEQDGQHEKKTMRVHKWLKTTDRRWLLIYDNAEQENLIRGSWPRRARGNVILTSRKHYHYFEDDQRRGEMISCLTPGESYHLLMRQLGPEWQAAHMYPESLMYDVEMLSAKKLCDQISGIPLAVKLTASLILSMKVSVHGFLGVFAQTLKVHPIRQNGPYDAPAHALDTIWSIAFDALSTNAKAILRVLAMLSPDVIMIDLFQPSDQERFTEMLSFCRPDDSSNPSKVRASFEAVVSTSVQLSKAIEELASRGMVARNGRCLTDHREVQEAVSYDNKAQLNDSFDAAANLLYDAFPNQMNGRPFEDERHTCRRLVHHVLTLVARYQQHKNGRSQTIEDGTEGMSSVAIFVRLLCNVAWYFHEATEYEEGLEIIDVALEACQSKLSLEFAHLMNTKGAILSELNRLRQARDAFRTSVQLREILLGKQHAEYATALGNLSHAEFALGRQDESRALNDEVVAIRQATGDDSGPLLGLNYLQSGRIHFLRGDYQAAYEDYQKSEGLLMKKAGRIPSYVGDVFYAYGNCDLVLKDYAMASKHYEDARRICDDNNPLHPLMVSIYYKMACTQFEQGRYSKALSKLDKALSIAETRSPNVIDGATARVLWKRAEVMMNNPTSGLESRKEAQSEMDHLLLRRSAIAQEMDIDLAEADKHGDQGAGFDFLLCTYFR